MRKTLLLVCLLIAGCAGSPFAVMSMDSTQLSQLEAPKLCMAYGELHSAKVETEIIRRKLLTEREWALVKQKKIALDMSECGMFAAWGVPTDGNQSVGRWGIHTQWIYGRFPYATYVYTENGRITSWQD